MEREPTSEDAAIHHIARRHGFTGPPQLQFADHVAGRDAASGEVTGQVTGDLCREHWIVPVHGLTRADPGGIVQAIARCDGSVILDLTCGDFRTMVRLDVSRAAQLSTGIWEAAGASQQLTGYLGDGQSPPQPLPTGSGIRPVARPSHHHRNTPLRISSPRPRQKSIPVNKVAAMDADETSTIGCRIRRIRKSRDKSLRVISGLAGMSRSTLHRIERGQREITLSEIVALANALEIDPSKLIRFPFL